MGARIHVVLKHNGTNLEPTELDDQAQKDIADREKRIRDSGDSEQIKKLDKALAASQLEHKNVPRHRMIVLSQELKDEIIWQVTDASGKPKTGFTVQMKAINGGENNPFSNKELDDKNTGKVVSGDPVDGIPGNRYHYEVKMKEQPRAAYDPDCYISD